METIELKSVQPAVPNFYKAKQLFSEEIQFAALEIPNLKHKITFGVFDLR